MTYNILQNTRRNKIIFLWLFVICYLLLVVPQAQAFEISLFSTKTTGNLGEYIPISVYFDTKGKNINTIEGEISIPVGGSVSEINDANSSISFWVEKPNFNEKNKIIRFSGVIPGGFISNNVFLFSFNFREEKSGKTSLIFRNTHAFLNDGSGTSIKGSEKVFNINISKVNGDKNLLSINDIEPPESFVPLLSSDSNLFDGKYFVVFSTQDKNSGIDYYEISEETGFRKFKYNELAWFKVESPYLLKDQNLKSNIYVKAVDRKGNERISYISPVNGSILYKYEFIFVIILLTGVIIGYYWRPKNVVKKRFRSRRL